LLEKLSVTEKGEDMRKITFGVANSLDNRIARSDDAIDWLLFSDEVMSFMEEFWKNVDTVLMGRKTYEITSKMEAPETPNVKTYVFSRTLKKGPDDTVQLVSEDAVAFIRDLKEQDGKDICLMGGGDFARTLFEAGLVDEISVNIHPLLLGAGAPLFLDMDRQIDLELLECKTMEHDCVALTYRVKK